MNNISITVYIECVFQINKSIPSRKRGMFVWTGTQGPPSGRNQLPGCPARGHLNYMIMMIMIKDSEQERKSSGEETESQVVTERKRD